jgi:predicted GNAT family N-acyltransferase
MTRQLTFWARMLVKLIVVVCASQTIHSPRFSSAHAGEIGLNDNWQVTVDGTTIRQESLYFPWRDLPGEKEQIHVHYKKSFDLHHSELGQTFYLILPQNWANLKITINGLILLNENPETEALSRIFEKRIVTIPAPILAPENSVEISARGSKLRGGFRSNNALITPEGTATKSAVITNFFKNDIHLLFIFLSLVVSLLAFRFSRLENKDSKALIHLSLSSLAIIPHHLLATGFYAHIFRSEETAFTLNLAAQLYCWPNFIAYFYYLTAEKRQPKFNPIETIKKFRIGLISIPITILATFLPFEVIASVSYLMFFACVTQSIFMILSLQLRVYFLSFLSGVALLMTTLFSDLLFSDSYYLCYGVAIFLLSGVHLMVLNYEKAYKNGRSFGQIVRQSLPASVHGRIQQLVETGANLNTIREAISGNSILTITLIDICDWGVMNNTEQTGIPSGLVRAARAMAFAHFEGILAQYDLELIKTSGDNLKFCGGLLIEHPNKEAFLAERALAGVKEVLDSLDKLSAELREAQLPLIKVKIALTMGTADYGIEAYNQRLQFDIQGHTVNAAYRLEAAMDDTFYQTHGKNVALVSTSVIRPCEDLNLRKRFPDRVTITDKHGITYDCCVGIQHERKLKIEDFAQALFGLFSHQSAPKLQDEKGDREAEDSDDTNGDASRSSRNQGFDGMRRDRRKRLYISDGFRVDITAGSKKWKAWAIDLSTNGAGLALPIDESGPSGLQPGELLSLGFQLKQQQVMVKARLVNVRSTTMSEKNYERLGVEILPAERYSTERKFPRIPINDFFSPIAYCTDPYHRNRFIHFRAEDVSAEGLCLRTSARNLGLLPGTRLTLSLLVPGSRTFKVPANVRHVGKLPDADRIRIGFQVENPLDGFQQTIGQYLLDFNGKDLTAAELKRSGFNLEGYQKALTFKYPESKEEWDQLWELRLQKWNCKTIEAEELKAQDRFDAHSRQIICKVADRVVACARLVFNDGQTEKIEHLSYGATIPGRILHSRFVEAGRVVVHPDFRGDDIFRGLITELGRVTKQTRNQYILQSCSESLFPVYRRFGFKSLGSYNLSGKKWILAVLDIDRVMRGKDVTAVGWALSGSDISQALKEAGGTDTDDSQTLKTQLLELQRPLILARYRSIKRRQTKEENRNRKDQAG